MLGGSRFGYARNVVDENDIVGFKVKGRRRGRMDFDSVLAVVSYEVIGRAVASSHHFVVFDGGM